MIQCAGELAQNLVDGTLAKDRIYDLPQVHAQVGNRGI